MKIPREVLRKKGFADHCLLFNGSLDIKKLGDLGEQQANWAKEYQLDSEEEQHHDIFYNSRIVIANYLHSDFLSHRVNEKFLDVLSSKANLVLDGHYLAKKFPDQASISIELPYKHRIEEVGAYFKSVLIIRLKGNIVTDGKTYSECPSFLFIFPHYDPETDYLLAEASNQDIDVVGHFRWQPCGPGKTQVKLIWIDEHPRTYKGNTDGQK